MQLEPVPEALLAALNALAEFEAVQARAVRRQRLANWLSALSMGVALIFLWGWWGARPPWSTWFLWLLGSVQILLFTGSLVLSIRQKLRVRRAWARVVAAREIVDRDPELAGCWPECN